MSGFLISPSPADPVDVGVPTSLDDLSTSTKATPIEGNDVRLRFSREEIGASGDYPLSHFPDNK